MKGLPTNMSELFEQVQKFQQNMSQTQNDLEKKEVEASSGGGMVVVKINCAHQLLQIKIDPTVVNNQDVQMLEDLVKAAVNEGMRKAKEMIKEEMGKLTGGIPIPGINL